MTEPAALIQRYCQQQDQAAFRHFYDTEAPRLWKFLIARGADENHAYDLLGEAFERFLKTVCKQPSAPKALLYRIAINLQIDQYRRQQHRQHDSLDEQHVADPGMAAADQAEIRDLLKNLPENEQNLLLMRYWIGLSHREIAAITDQPEGTVRRQAAACLQKLRQLCD